jgi:capsular exopolysaccharide synthesis family protein
MDTFDSHRSTVPARMPPPRPGVPASRPTAGLPEAAASPLSIQVALRGARRYWWLVLMLWIVGSVGLSAVIYVKVRPSYRAISLLRVDPAENDLYGVRTRSDSLDPFLQTQVQLITSPNVLTAAGTNPKAAVLSRIQTAGDIVQELRRVIQVNVIPGTYLIEVSMTSNEAYEAATLVNAVVEAFMESNVEWSDGMTRNQIKNLETYLGDLRNQTDEMERRWKELVAQGDPDTQVIKEVQQAKAANPEDRTVKEGQTVKPGTITIEEYKRVRQELFQVNLDLTQAQAWLDGARKGKSQAKEGGPAEDEARIYAQDKRRFSADPEVIQLATEMLAAKNKLDDVLRVAAQANDPAERMARRKLDALKARYNNLWETKTRAYHEGPAMGGQMVDPEQEIHEAEAKVEALKIKQATLEETSKRLAVSSSHQATNGVEISLILDQRGNLREMQEAVNRRLEQLKFEAKGEARIRPVNAAVPPGRPISDKRMTYLAMTPVGVLGTVLGLIVLLEIRSGRVADPDVLSSRVKHEVFSIAPLPSIRPGDDPTSDRAEQRLARFVQSLDHLRVAVCEGPVATGEGRCVMITSATGGEGKTTLSAHLAARCANAGTSTLLIDADMRRASLGRLLDVPVGPGLGDVLGGDIDLDGALITVQAGGFHFLSAGTPGRDPSRVLKSDRLSDLIGRLRRTYDLVIIDTPPILPVADALIVGRWADGAVMAARFDASRLPLVERANRQLALAGIPVLGVVVNGVRGQDASYGNYAYSYNYYPGQSDRPAQAPSA